MAKNPFEKKKKDDGSELDDEDVPEAAVTTLPTEDLDAILVQEEQQLDPMRLVVISPRISRDNGVLTCHIGGKMYVLRDGVRCKVPHDVKRQLEERGLCLERLQLRRTSGEPPQYGRFPFF